MDPADPEAVQYALHAQVALVKRHEQKLREMIGLIQNMGAIVFELAHQFNLLPAPPSTVPSVS